MTMSEYQQLMGDQSDEGRLYQKLSLITYALTEFIGNHTTLDNGTLGATFPCGDGFIDPNGGVFRYLSSQSGMPIGQVHSLMGGYIASRISNYPAGSGETHSSVLLGLISSLRMEGRQLDFVGRKSQTVAGNNGNEVFISYGAYTTPQGQPVVAGYKLNRMNGMVSHDEKRSYSSAVGVNMILFEPIGAGSLRYNDPCYYVANPGGGSGGSGGSGGGSGGTLDDDGALKSITKGPLFQPGACDYSIYSTTQTGLRISQFHLADRNEGGLFSGNSEVYVSATLYNSGNPSSTYRTNVKGRIGAANIFGIVYHYMEGLNLRDVPPSDISSTTNIVITPSASDDWSIIEQGFCGFPGPDTSFGYDRLFITFYERDFLPDFVVYSQQMDLPSIPYEDMHICRQTLASDDWFSNMIPRITFNDLFTNGGKLYLAETPGGYVKSTTQPSADKSWFLLELY